MFHQNPRGTQDYRRCGIYISFGCNLSIGDGSDRVLKAEDGLPPVIMFAFDDYFPAVAVTDMMVRLGLCVG